MTNTFANLKKKRGQSLEKITQKMEKFSGKGNYKDERIWNITLDDTKSGEAIIRFLPAPNGEDDDIVRIFSHFFRGKAGWYVENSLTTFGEADPCAELNGELWDAGEKNKARSQKRITKYYANIYVVDDPANPDNNGKVFLYEFGPVIFQVLNDAMHPKFKSDDPVNPFDLWEGCDFKMRVYSEERSIGDSKRLVPQYDRCVWSNPKPMLDDDGAMENVWSQCHSLAGLLDRKNFKTYDELKTRLDKVLGIGSPSAMSTAEDIPVEEAAPIEHKRAEPKEEKESVPWDDDDEDDEESFFADLAK